MTRTALVIGAGGAVGEAAAADLARLGWRVRASMRTPREDAAARLAALGAEVMRHDLADTEWARAAEGADALVFAVRLDLAAAALECAPIATARIVAFSSNNVAVHPEATTYRLLAVAEAALRARHGDIAIIRPTLIYGEPRLQTVTQLMRRARAWPLLPLPGSGRALTQPVFYEDLGRAAAVLAEQGEGGVFAVGGPDIVSMRELYERVIAAAGGGARILPVPGAALRLAAPLLAPFGFSAEQAARTERDRTACAMSPVPPELAPATPLREGLARLAAALF